MSSRRVHSSCCCIRCSVLLLLRRCLVHVYSALMAGLLIENLVQAVDWEIAFGARGGVAHTRHALNNVFHKENSRAHSSRALLHYLKQKKI